MVNFYHRNLLHAAATQVPLNSYFIDSRKNDKREIAWIPETVEAFEKVNNDFINATLLVHPPFNAELRILSDTSDFAMGAALEQLLTENLSQQSKVSQHVKLIPEHFVAPDGRFDHVHIDIVGQLPNHNGFEYVLTMIDRFSRAFFKLWVSQYSAPKILTSEQGSQFESRLFTALLSLIGCQRIRTTAYHPAANGLIERSYRVFKAAIMCHQDTDWTRTLSTILLGLRCHVRADTNASPAEFKFGTTLRLPGEFFLLEDFTPDPNIFIEEFCEYMRLIRPVPVTHKHKKRALPYNGPYKVFLILDKSVFNIDVNGNKRSVSVELLKSAFFLPDDLDNLVVNSDNQGNQPSTSQSESETYSLLTHKYKKVLTIELDCSTLILSITPDLSFTSPL
ncbi:uncharacterized protein LOC131673915 [Phymastichus coffea]|uniref:uncharacterized protein LOC131673915 n=1 Tax=Phymastichus coffea TaxID=108790 RepID=UPI00273BD3A8|nr:uncharacterized protein LOC131673915 [Phymastichus coffea]